MTTELIKQLKDAGFPKEFVNTELTHGGYPTLSELIEACGDHFIELERIDKKKWLAQGGWIENDCCRRPHKDQVAASPEEAVAKLWLALNSQPRDEALDYLKSCPKNPT
jgi:hypothetical protein